MYKPDNGKRRTNRRVNDVRSHRVGRIVGRLVEKKIIVVINYDRSLRILKVKINDFPFKHKADAMTPITLKR